MKFTLPDIFIFQWHITGRCNWKCKHCYQDGYKVKELSLKELDNIANQCVEFLDLLKITKEKSFINIGGGEPFLREDIFDFLDILNSKNRFSSPVIMTNGSFITDEMAKKLRKHNVRSVQVSLEGLEKVNDQIRPKGSFKQIVGAIKILKKNKIHTRVSVTLTRINFPSIWKFTEYLKSIGVDAVGIRRYVPQGRGEQLKKYSLSKTELERFYIEREKVKKELDEPGKFIITYGCEDAIFLAKNNIKGNGVILNCGVVFGRHLNIFTNGDILLCRRFPIKIGSALKQSITDIYFNSNLRWKFMEDNNYDEKCLRCPYFNYCRGGARCVAYALTGKLFVRDPYCFR